MRYALIALYTTAGVLTFGHVFNSNYVAPLPPVSCGTKPDILKDFDGNRAWYDCEYKRIDAKYSGTSYFIAGFPAAYAGLFWPAYWAGHYAIMVTK